MSHAAVAALSLGHGVAKAYQSGTHRVVAPAATLAQVSRFMPAMGITRIANITGLDVIGLPVVMVCQPNSRSLAVTQGKGIDLTSAKASGLMEAVEAFHAERIMLPLKLASYEELRYTHRVVDVHQLPRTGTSALNPHLLIHWIEGYDLLQHEPVWVPFDLVHTNFTVAMRGHASGFFTTSNGLASGNHLLEAISHGICEVVERDALSLWYLRDAAAAEQCRVLLDTITDPACRAVLQQYERAGMALGVWEITSEIGIPTFLCGVIDGRDSELRRLCYAEGLGCHPVREIALLRALTEAAQSRLALIAGSRDDAVRAAYQQLRDRELHRQQRAALLHERPQRRFTDAPSYHADTLDDDVAWELDRLRAAGIQRVIVIDLTRDEFRVPVVRVIVPGLEHISGQHTQVVRSRTWDRLKQSL